MNASVSTDDITVDTIVEAVRKSIVQGDLPPGSIVNSVDLAQRFGTSRTPVREALLMLSQFGLISLAARRRPQVAPVSAKAIRDLYALRAALHGYMSEAIVANAPDQDLQVLHAHAVELTQEALEQGSEAYMLRVEAYLDVETRLCGNELVIGVLSSLKWKINWFRRIGKMTEAQVRSLAVDRVRVARAYLDRDAVLANALNRSMLQRGSDYCEANFLSTPAAAPVTMGK